MNTISLDLGFPLQIAVTPDGSRAYLAVSKATGSTATAGSSRLDVIDLSTDTIAATIPFAGNAFGVAGVAITPDRARVYATRNAENSVRVIDTDPGSPAINQQVDFIPTTGNDLTRINVTSDGALVFVVSRRNDEMLIIDTDLDSPGFHPRVGSVPVGAVPFDVVCQEMHGAVAYVSNRGENTVSVIDDVSTVAGSVTGMSSRKEW